MQSKQDENRKRLEKKVRDARHMSKPDDPDTVVIRDANGRWLFEYYPGKKTER